jgi:hypothetical protein
MFVEHYGGTKEWDAAEEISQEELRVGEDGGQYTKAEFVEHYGGTKEWDAAEEISQEELRIGENGGQYTKAEFVEHFRGTEEWDAAAATSPPLREKVEAEERATEERASDWFYSDANDEVHGPFTLARLRRWDAKGHFHAHFMVRHGNHGEDVLLSDVVQRIT